MTVTAPPAQLWSTMPGWGIAADLTPPELINARQLSTLRKWLGVGLAVLLVACLGEFVVAERQHSAAAAAMNQVQGQTTQIQAGARKYAAVTQLQGSVTQIQTQIAQLMSGDVDLVTLLGRLRSTLPAPMTISAEAVTISLAGAAGAPVAGAPVGTPGTTSTGTATIGAVTISGTGRTLDNLASYIEKLQTIPGVIDVNPTSNVISDKVTHYSLSLSLTSAVLSHRFDVAKTGTK